MRSLLRPSIALRGPLRLVGLACYPAGMVRSLSFFSPRFVAPLVLLITVMLAGSVGATPPVSAAASAPASRPPSRWPGAPFFVAGDGKIAIRSVKTGRRFRGRYRDAQGRYRRRALAAITRVYGGNEKDPEARMALRFVELLAYLQRAFKSPWVEIASGYRAPTYNAKLRAKGRTVAKASLHLYGMAADLRLRGVDSKKMWELIRDGKLAGAGYYGSPWVHVDVGPARSWTQGTADVRSGRSDANKMLLLIPERDVYRPGQHAALRLVRMTAYPVGLRARRPFELERQQGATWTKVGAARLRFGRGHSKRGCVLHAARETLRGRWRIPKRLPAGRYRLRVHFCQTRQHQGMPKEVTSNEFELQAPLSRELGGSR